MKRIFAASAAGAVYSILSVIGVLLLVLEQVDSSTDEQILAYYDDAGNRTTEALGAVLVLLGAAFLVWFLSELRRRIRGTATDADTSADLAFGAGLVAAGLLAGAAALLSATSAAVEISSRFEVDPDTARFAVSTGYVFLVGSVLLSCVLVLATSVVAVRTSLLPTWLGWAGFAVVVLAVVEAFLLPVFVIPIWVLAVSVAMTLGPGREARSSELPGS